MLHDATKTGETAIEAAFVAAGADTAANKVRMAAMDAMRTHHNNVERAAPTFAKMMVAMLKVSSRPVDLLAAVAGPYLQNLQTDLLGTGLPGHVAHNDGAGAKHANGNGGDQQTTVTRQNHAAPVASPSAAQNTATDRRKERSAVTVFDRELTRTGQMWGNVNYRELDSMIDDADLAQEIKKSIGLLRGDDRHKTIRQLMKPQEFHACLRKARGRK